MSEESQTKTDVELSASPTSGVKFSLKNFTYSQVTNILKGLGVVIGLGYVIYMFHEDHKQIADTMGVMTYVISLPQEERKQLRLTMPDSLRERIAR